MEQSDVQYFIIISSVSLIFLLTMFIALFYFFQKKKIEYILDRNNRESKYKEELLQAQIDANEQSLRHIGSELHDNIGQLLSVAKMKLSMILSERIDKEEEDGLKSTHEVISKSLTEVRQLSKTLNHTYIKKIGFIPALEAEVERINRLKLCDATLTIYGKPLDLNSDHALSLYRIIQESISNALKHAHCRKLEIVLKYGQKILYIHVNDDGIGFDRATESDGTGLFNIKNRVESLSAELDIQSQINHGTKLTITYPIKL